MSRGGVRYRRASLLPSGEGTVLDIGAGDGSGKEVLEARGYRWLGVDIAGSDGLSLVASAQALPFGDGAFDALACVSVLEHVALPEVALSEARRVAKRGAPFLGSVAFLEPYHGSNYHMSPDAVAHALERNGFELLHTEPGWHAFEALCREALFKAPGAALLGRFAGFCLRLFRALLFAAALALVSRERKARIRRYREADRLRFAGSVVFLARAV